MGDCAHAIAAVYGHWMTAIMNRVEAWPELPLAAWQPTCETLHLWTQIVGKVRLAKSPWLNHGWQVTLYVDARGLTTSLVAYEHGQFEIHFDFVEHILDIRTTGGTSARIPLRPQTVAEFHDEVMGALHGLGITVAITDLPCEIAGAIPFTRDDEHASYDKTYANRFWRVLLQVDRVFKQFRTGFLGKSSPVHFFWGSFDLAVTRFNGKRAPAREGADSITREAYSHEVISAGFWPGSGPVTDAAFYAYAAPSPEGLSSAKVRPDAAHWDAQLGEFILMYDAVRNAPSPRAALMEFLESTYEAAASLASWNREELERKR
jgi:hypothetical protein